jgi:hypothetical protein
MTAHMRMLYKLVGEHLDLADLWSTEVKIQTDLGQFSASGLAVCITAQTTQIHRQHSSSSGTESSCRFFLAPGKEEKGRTVLRGMGAWLCFVSQGSSFFEDPIFEDIEDETCFLLGPCVSYIFLQLQRRLPKFKGQYRGYNVSHSLARLLLRRFNEWNITYV